MTSSSTTLSPREVGELLAVSDATVRRWINDGSLPAVRLGGRYRVEPHEAFRLLRRTGHHDEGHAA